MLELHPELSTVREAIIQAVELVCQCYHSGDKVLICGNGGSAADSEHIVGELMKGFVLRRQLPESDIDRLRQSGVEDWERLASFLQRGISAIALTGHAALSSAILNDTDPQMAFAQQVYVYGRPGDILIGLSTSGNAGNVLNALNVARAFELSTVGFTGSAACRMDSVCDIIIRAPSIETYRVQEYHLPIYHTLCLMVEAELFG